MNFKKSLGNSNQTKSNHKIKANKKTTALTAIIFSNTFKFESFFFMS